MFVIFGLFLPFYPTNNPKNKIFEKMKKKKTPRDIIILLKCSKNHDHMLHCSRDTTREGCNFSFLAIFSPFTPLTTQKIRIFKKNEKISWRYHNFTHVYHKLWSHDVQFVRYGMRQMDGQTDREKKVTYRGWCPT